MRINKTAMGSSPDSPSVPGVATRTLILHRSRDSLTNQSRDSLTDQSQGNLIPTWRTTKEAQTIQEEVPLAQVYLHISAQLSSTIFILFKWKQHSRNSRDLSQFAK